MNCKPLETDLVTFEANHSFSQATQFPPLAYDAVMALGIAGCRAKNDFFVGRDLLNGFLAAEFEGASGLVLIDEKTGTRHHSSATYFISNTVVNEPDEAGIVSVNVVVAAEYYRRGHINGNHSQAAWYTSDDIAFNYSDMTLDPPQSIPYLEVDHDVGGFPQFLILTLIACIIMLSSLLFAGWTWNNRTSHVVLASQPEFLILICVGVFLMAAAVVTMGAENPPFSLAYTDVTCMLNYWFFCTGFGVAFSALFAKTWRINKVRTEAECCLHNEFPCLNDLPWLSFFPVEIAFDVW